MPKFPCRPWLLIAALACLVAAPPAAAGAERISLRVSNGWSLVAPREYNDFMLDFPRSYDAIVGVGISRETTRTIRWAQEFELTVDIPLRSGLIVSASAGLLGASSEGNLFAVEWGTVTEEFTRDDRVRAVVARLGLTYVIPLTGKLSLRPHAGLDGYWSSFEDAGTRTETYAVGGSDQIQAWTADTHAFNLGWTAGVALDWAVFGRLGLILDAGYRRAKLSGFTGRYEETYYGEPQGARDFTLLYFEEYVDYLQTTYKRFNLPGGWSGGVITVVHDAVIDLSGFFLKIGLRVSF
ncbi:MAG: hypothetical protein NTZ26_12375 [Candidatus Aminicenantes bacterium]|nr:hypothetical protein [Candidatus Aminicenantes bacterium]